MTLSAACYSSRPLSVKSEARCLQGLPSIFGSPNELVSQSESLLIDQPLSNQLLSNQLLLEQEYLDYLNKEVEMLYHPLKSYVAKHLNPNEAQDILHDAVIVLMTKLKQSRMNNPFAIKAFLYSTAKWLMRSHRAKLKNTPLLIDYDDMEVFIDEACSGTGTKSCRQDPVSQLEQSNLHEEVGQIVLRLPQKRDKALLLYHYWYECPDLFQLEFDVSSEHYYRLLYRAKKRLLKLLPDSTRQVWKTRRERLFN